MYFLDGDRIYIKPKHGCKTLDEQFTDCLGQLRDINSGKKIFKLNYFLDAGSETIYPDLIDQIRDRVSRTFEEKIIQNFIAQPPLTCRIIVEAFYYDPKKWETR
ncbi:MAG TPA: hypothetical protein VKA10_10405, partial [Prolixibacteraceae bacterium]|nr:hypothetical protein [Prolixibacteraceae bacterium]